MFTKYLLRRLIYVIPTLLITTFVVFSLILLIPGDPVVALLGENATPEKIAQLQEQMGLNKPIIIQYGDWLLNAVQGDLGRSLFTGEPVFDAVIGRLGVTLQLVVISTIISVSFGMLFAVISVYFPNNLLDYLARFVSIVGASFPNFWIAMLLVILFSLHLGWFPSTGFTNITDNPGGFLKTVMLPAISLGAIGIAVITRHLRSSLLEVMESDYVRTAYSKGNSRWKAIFSHGLRNAMLPVVTTIGIGFGNAIGGTVVIETIFAIPGVGQLAVNAILQRDFMILQGVILILIMLVIIINFITDIIYAILDPRIEY
ncbi:ABC transporter permease [Pseudogracilibacillus sp. SO30301A]|uniref:ABC transporter permease n=1 Tax=Pseudogracilibacillus sp. SO30301A TaxID=3098291 RepID=UPI00300E5DE4